MRELEREEIKATVIGRTTDSNDKIIYRQGKAASWKLRNKTNCIRLERDHESRAERIHIKIIRKEQPSGT